MLGRYAAAAHFPAALITLHSGRKVMLTFLSTPPSSRTIPASQPSRQPHADGQAERPDCKPVHGDRVSADCCLGVPVGHRVIQRGRSHLPAGVAVGLASAPGHQHASIYVLLRCNPRTSATPGISEPPGDILGPDTTAAWTAVKQRSLAPDDCQGDPPCRQRGLDEGLYFFHISGWAEWGRMGPKV
ncbi:hypothetical protein NDU88_003619 [Pleurodeles waltl]|uniref:Uncharacterized protein n=1 Tax=Pleurodeles waltl TaxID=8319 RepID=A0AAV7VHX2_PLEWA|nr:hypothetical protein NDU88_003619 [Pleurodeles waltl]